ncbi:MAG: tRNA lysidine(34) synthetase TilS [Gammaproteobacteria bacterium]|nr:MAG: tRNA lysidine(34) synthetase TilS [Gammaproteobacteria bacterium]
MASPDADFPASLTDHCLAQAHAPRWWVALSGGLDSIVLLHALVQFSRHTPSPPLVALHVHHGLQSQAGDWADFCQSVCADWGVECRVLPVTVRQDQGQGLEMAAREARYAALAAQLGSGDVLWMAHHLDDQAETMLMRLVRGSGLQGLAGIPAMRALAGGQVVRPLLGVARRELETYASQHGLRWVDDPSNSSITMDRNFLRHTVFPLLEQRWPAYRQGMARSAHWLRQQSTVEQAALAVLLAGRQEQDRYGARLDIQGVAAWPEGLRQALLRHWLASMGVPMPSAVRLASLDHDVLCARDDAQGQWQSEQVVIHRFRGALYAHAPVLPARAGDWLDAGQPFTLSPVMQLLAVPAAGPGCLKQAPPWRVAYRQGGERCRPAGRDHSQTLKHLLQEYAIPPWLRDATPLLYAGDTLVAVADGWVCHGFEAGPGEKGWKIHWKIAAGN